MLEKAGNEQKKGGLQPQKESLKKHVFIDYPQENEVINPKHYAIKIGTNTNSRVEISIDNGDWQPCRFAGGYWWHDWTGYTSGAHKITARVCDNNNKVIVKSKVSKCLSRD